jgi:TolB-like protein
MFLKILDNLLIIKLFILLWLAFNLSGCSPRMAFGNCAYRIQSGECYQEKVPDADIMASSYVAADKLIHYASTQLTPKSRLLVTSIANIDNLEDSTALGRLIGEQLSARFSQYGYTVLEPKWRKGLNLIRETGEFVLSRGWRSAEEIHHVDKIIAGTYTVGKNKVYVSLKMLNENTGEIISSYGYNLPMGSNTSALLRPKYFWW